MLVTSETENVRAGRYLIDHLVKPSRFTNEESEARKRVWGPEVPQLVSGQSVRLA